MRAPVWRGQEGEGLGRGGVCVCLELCRVSLRFDPVSQFDLPASFCVAVFVLFSPPVSALTMLLTTLSSRDPFPRSRSSTSDMPLASCLVCHCPPTVRFLSPLALVSRWSSTVTPFPHSLSDPSACCTNFRGRAGACVCVQGRPRNVFAIDSGYYARPAQRATAFGYFPSC